jgi:pimeloyl-ACP methyl ester carboxylesterase
MNLRIVAAILKKDVRSLYPLILIVALLFAADVLYMRADLGTAVWASLRTPLLLLAGTVLILAVFQLDPPASLVDDWLCRPVPRAELLVAKLVLLFAVLRLSQIVATLVIEPALGTSLAETLQRALLLHDSNMTELYTYGVALLPLPMITALVTRSVMQGIGVLLGMFVCAFVIPTPFVSAPGPLQPAIGEALFGVGLSWLAIVPGGLVAFVLFGVACWLAFWRRRIHVARFVLVACMLALVVLLLLPMWLLPWQHVYAAQTALVNPDLPHAPDTSAIYLRNGRTCFAATRVRGLATDPDFAEARRAASVREWTYEDQAAAGPESVAFLTSIEVRQLPSDWHVGLTYVSAEYSSTSGSSPIYSLRPTLYETEGSSLSHAWVLPEHALRRLSGEPQVELELRYYLTLLEPHEFRLPADGRRHTVPKLGYCSAKRDSTGSFIEVNCFSGFDQPAQVSAELEDIPASRVYGLPDYSPGWARWPFSRSTKLHIGSPRLARGDHITVTAWTLAGYVDESLKLPGILGSDTRTCPLPSSEGRHFQQALWRDSAKHEATSITVDQGVQLEVLDFGGQGPPILLLAGLGATAHSFDELAPMLARKHRVVAITRRGTGYSSRPDFGFDTPRLAQDVLQVMDALKLEQVLLVGHSIAGEELTWLGGHHPERFDGLVYLDAAYDRSGNAVMKSRQSVLSRSLPPEPPIPPEAMRNYQAMSALLAERGHVRLTEGELIALWNVNKPFLAGTLAMDARSGQAILAAVRAPDYAAIKVPALAIYAIPDPAKPLPRWYDASNANLRATLEELGRIINDTQRKNIELFRGGVSQGVALELRNATHYLIQSNQEQVLDAIETFSLKVKEQ